MSTDDGVFDGDAELEVTGQRCPVRVRLAGHLSPIDGRYHWQGLAYGHPRTWPPARRPGCGSVPALPRRGWSIKSRPASSWSAVSGRRRMTW